MQKWLPADEQTRSRRRKSLRPHALRQFAVRDRNAFVFTAAAAALGR
jgi:hypothetical protein